MDRFLTLAQDIATLWENSHQSYLSGMANTLLLAIAATALGCVIGFSCGVLSSIPKRQGSALRRASVSVAQALVRAYVEVFRGTPMMLQAVFLYYGLPYFSDGAVRFQSIWAASVLVVSINTGAYMAESVRGGILSVDIGQTEGAKALGMTHLQTMLYVILPQALRSILPQIGNNFIINVKDTSVMFIIGFPDFFAAHRSAVGSSFLYFPSATLEMAGYLTMTLVASFLLRLLEKKLAGSGSFELAAASPRALASGTYSHPERRSPLEERSRERKEVR